MPSKRFCVYASVSIALLILVVGGFALLNRQPAPPTTLEHVRQDYGMGVRYIDVEGVEVAYKDEGKGEVIVLLHGSFGNLHMFDELAALLATDHRVVRYDQPPTGLSGPVPAEFTLTSETFLRGFLDALDVKTAVFVGTSSGGIIAYRFAAAFPERTRALVLSNVPPSAPVDNAGARARLPAYYRYSLGACIQFSGPFSKTCWRHFLESNYWHSNPVSPSLVERYYDLNRRSGSLVYTSMTAIMRDDAKVQSFLSEVKTPTALLWGDKDPVLPPEKATKMASRLTATNPMLYWLEDVSHYPPMEAPAIFETELRHFLKNLNQVNAEINGEAQ